MAGLSEDIKSYSDKIIHAFASDDLILDYSLAGFRAIDAFFDINSRDGKPLPGSRFEGQLGAVIFAIGAYIGETVIRNFPGAVWKLDDAAADGELTAEIILSNGTHIWPVQKVMKRLENGPDDSIFVYGHLLREEFGM